MPTPITIELAPETQEHICKSAVVHFESLHQPQHRSFQLSSKTTEATFRVHLQLPQCSSLDAMEELGRVVGHLLQKTLREGVVNPPKGLTRVEALDLLFKMLQYVNAAQNREVSSASHFIDNVKEYRIALEVALKTALEEGRDMKTGSELANRVLAKFRMDDPSAFFVKELNYSTILMFAQCIRSHLTAEPPQPLIYRLYASYGIVQCRADELKVGDIFSTFEDPKKRFICTVPIDVANRDSRVQFIDASDQLGWIKLEDKDA